ncbi:MAG: hypothetical protein PUB18_04810 [bacterium]|nr:hypothetical protein [bacterium]
MLNQTKGSKDNHKNRRLFQLISKRKKKKLAIEKQQLLQKEIDEKKKRQPQLSQKKSEPIISKKYKPKVGIPLEAEQKNHSPTSSKKSELITPKKYKPKVSIPLEKLSNPTTKAKPTFNQDLSITNIPKEKEARSTPPTKSQSNSIPKNLDRTIPSSISIKKNIIDTTMDSAPHNKPLSKKSGLATNQEINITQLPKNQSLSYSPPAKENFLELALTTELEIMLKNYQYDLNKLIIEFEILNQQFEKTVETEDIENITKGIDDLIRKLEIIKRELELLTNSSTFKDIYKLHDPYLTNLIEEYKNSVNQNKEVLNYVSNLEKENLYTSIIDKIIEFEKEKDYFTEQLEETKKKYQVRDENFETWKKEYIDIECITKSLDEIMTESEKYLRDIQEKINSTVKVTEIVETKMKSSLGIIGKTLLLMALLKRNPMLQANGVAALEVITAISLINDLCKPKQVIEKHIKTDIIDYRNLISHALNDTDDIAQLINTSLTQIQNLRETYQKEFQEYQYDIPEYKEFLSKLDSIENEMLDRQNNINRISQELAYQHTKNDQKVKTYENLSS